MNINIEMNIEQEAQLKISPVDLGQPAAIVALYDIDK